MEPKRIFVTGTAGFIGFHLAQRLLADGHSVTGYDGVTNYYDVSLKRARLALLAEHPNFTFVEAMLEDGARVKEALAGSRAQLVFHLAGQAGVRYSIDHPQSYVQSNLVGTSNVLEAARETPPEHLIFASTSSVYGGNTKIPFAETDRADSPVSLYAATKKSGEAMVHSYSHLWGIAATSVRFFTVYGPWGRPDMALFKFVSAIQADKAIDIYGEGKMRRDFTYVDDLVDALVRLAGKPPVKGEPVKGDSLSAVAPYRVVNIAGGKPSELMAFVAAVESAMGKPAKRNMLPMQQGDVVATQSDTALLHELIGEVPETPIEVGVARFVEWYRHYYGVN
ncbi:MAG TPA: NAD-dependent epimerase/dehydratase family protein [Devosia sp.]|nr:NAD-dependent epimerase/dehydratase family protein [Devosia sp.]